jgi:maltooligosyltrehalose trehalohydrolase
VFGEDHRNLAALVESRDRGGWGLDGVWADDFHHVLRRMIAGDAQGYYEDYEGTCEELAATIRQGWLFTGQPSRHLGGPRGTDASAIPMRKFVVCLQNHDQIGNRATGDRLNHRVDAALLRAATAVLLTAPMTPLLFMGQEWAASTPFQFFTDLEPELGRLVTAGRRHEFRHFPEFADPAARERIPDPQARSTFDASRLDWNERDRDAHARTLALHTELLRLRGTHAALANSDALAGDADAIDGQSLVVRRGSGAGRFWIVACFAPGGHRVELPMDDRVRVVSSTEEDRFAADPQPPALDVRPGRVSIGFRRPGALILTVA